MKTRLLKENEKALNKSLFDFTETLEEREADYRKCENLNHLATWVNHDWKCPKAFHCADLRRIGCKHNAPSG